MREVNTGETVGVIRKLDNLGRIVPPAEFRKHLGLGPYSDVEMFMVKDGIFIKKIEE